MFKYMYSEELNILFRDGHFTSVTVKEIVKQKLETQ